MGLGNRGPVRAPTDQMRRSCSTVLLSVRRVPTLDDAHRGNSKHKWRYRAMDYGCTLNGQRNPPVSGCASTISVQGGFANPTSYVGTYGFNGSSTQFNHHTLFLDSDRSTCP